MNLPAPPERYSSAAENQRNVLLETADARNVKRGTDIEMSTNRIILHSPNGSRWSLSVSNAGVVSAVPA